MTEQFFMNFILKIRFFLTINVFIIKHQIKILQLLHNQQFAFTCKIINDGHIKSCELF